MFVLHEHESDSVNALNALDRVRPATIADRIAPYLRYYSSHRPTDDHGSRPIVLVAFEDEIAQTHFLRVARDEMARTGVNVPLRVSHKSMLERMGPLGGAWSAVEGSEPDYAFGSPRHPISRR